MSKYGAAKIVGMQSIWRSAMTIEYLASEEIGVSRASGEELLIELVSEHDEHTTQSLGYVRNRKRGDTWPALTTIIQKDGIDHDIFALVPGDASKTVFADTYRHTYNGAEVVKEYALRMAAIERALRDPAMRHYVDFERSQAYDYSDLRMNNGE